MDEKGFTIFEILIALFVMAFAWGWVWNIIKIVSSNFEPLTGMLIARCFGVFVAPLGAVLGFL